MPKVRDEETGRLVVGGRDPDALSEAVGNIAQIFQRIGLLHLHDQQSGALLSAFKEQGFDEDPSLKPLFAAAEKGPLGTTSAVFGVLMNYLQMVATAMF